MVSVWGAKSLHAVWCSQKKKKTTKSRKKKRCAKEMGKEAREAEVMARSWSLSITLRLNPYVALNLELVLP